MKNTKKIKRILAWAAIFLLAGTYLAALILAFLNHPMAQALFRGAFALTVTLPILLYAMVLMYRLLRHDDDKTLSENENKDRKH